MDGTSRAPASLALLVDPDSATRRLVRPLLLSHGLDVVQARRSLAALELLQRVPERFRLVIVSLEMPDLSGDVLLETLRLFRPSLATLCLTASAREPVAAAPGTCVPKTVRADELGSMIGDVIAGRHPPWATAVAPEVVARATAAFAATGSLVEAAREVARGMPSQGSREGQAD